MTSAVAMVSKVSVERGRVTVMLTVSVQVVWSVVLTTAHGEVWMTAAHIDAQMLVTTGHVLVEGDAIIKTTNFENKCDN